MKYPKTFSSSATVQNDIVKYIVMDEAEIKLSKCVCWRNVGTLSLKSRDQLENPAEERAAALGLIRGGNRKKWAAAKR